MEAAMLFRQHDLPKHCVRGLLSAFTIGLSLGVASTSLAADIPVQATIVPNKVTGVGADLGNGKDAVKVILSIVPPDNTVKIRSGVTTVESASGTVIWKNRHDNPSESLWWGEGACTDSDLSVWITGQCDVTGGNAGGNGANVPSQFDVSLAQVNARVDSGKSHSSDLAGHWAPSWPDDLADASEAGEGGGLLIPTGITTSATFPQHFSSLDNLSYKIMEIEVPVRVPSALANTTVGTLHVGLSSSQGMTTTADAAGVAVYVQTGSGYDLCADTNVPGTGLVGAGNRIQCAIVTNNNFRESAICTLAFAWSANVAGLQSQAGAVDNVVFTPTSCETFVPAVVLDASDPNGRGKVPNIPMNAVLPGNYSGTDASGAVRFAIRCGGPSSMVPVDDEQYTLRIPAQCQAKAELDASSLTISAGQHYSNVTTIRGKHNADGTPIVSSSMADSVTVVAMKVGEPNTVAAKMDLVNYTLQFGVAPGPISSNAISPGIVNERDLACDAMDDTFLTPSANGVNRGGTITQQLNLGIKAVPAAVTGTALGRASIAAQVNKYEINVHALPTLTGLGVSFALNLGPLGINYTAPNTSDAAVAGVSLQVTVNGDRVDPPSTLTVKSSDIADPPPLGTFKQINGQYAGSPTLSLLANDIQRQYQVGPTVSTIPLGFAFAAGVNTTAASWNAKHAWVTECNVCFGNTTSPVAWFQNVTGTTFEVHPQ
jgi:hypothetical protein